MRRWRERRRADEIVWHPPARGASALSLSPLSPGAGDHGEQLAVDAAIRGHGLLARQLMGSSGGVGDPAPRLLDDQATRRQVPGMELPFPEPVQAAAGDVAEVERGGTGAAHPLSMLQRLAPEGQVE